MADYARSYSTPERRLRGHSSFVLPHTESSSATSDVHISTPTIPQSTADSRIRSSELSDLHLEPTFVVPAAVTVVHPQLRDLISCPKERGVLYHVKGTSIVELTIDVHSDEGDDDDRGYDDNKRSGSGSRSPMSREWWCPSVRLLAYFKEDPYFLYRRSTHPLFSLVPVFAYSTNPDKSRPWDSFRTA